MSDFEAWFWFLAPLIVCAGLIRFAVCALVIFILYLLVKFGIYCFS